MAFHHYLFVFTILSLLILIPLAVENFDFTFDFRWLAMTCYHDLFVLMIRFLSILI